MVAPVNSSGKSIFMPISGSTLGQAYLTTTNSSGASERISLSGSSNTQYQSLNEAIGVLSQAKEALTKLSDIGDDIIKLAERASSSSTTTAQRRSFDRKFESLVGKFNNILDDTKRTVGVDLRNPAELQSVMAKAGLVPEVGGALGEVIKALGGRDGLVGSEAISIENFAFEDEPTVTRFQTSFSMSLSDLNVSRVSNDAWKGGSEISGLSITGTGASAEVLFSSSANYMLDNAQHYQSIVAASTSSPIPEVSYNASPPSADFSVLDASSDGQYGLVIKDDGSTKDLQVYNLSSGAVIRTLDSQPVTAEIQAATSDDGNELVYSVGAASELKFSDDQGATLNTLSVTGGDISGSLAAADNRFVFSSNATSLGADGSNYDLFVREGYASGGDSPTRIDIVSVGGLTSVLKQDSISISNDGSVIAFLVDGGASEELGRLFLYNVSTGIATDTGLYDVSKTALNSDASRLIVSRTNGEVRVYDVSSSGGGSSFTLSQLSDEALTAGTTSIDYAVIQGNSSIRGYFNTTGDYLTQNAQNLSVVASATTAGGVDSITKAEDPDMLILAIDDSGQYGIVQRGVAYTWSDGTGPHVTGAFDVTLWDFTNNQQAGTINLASSNENADISGSGNNWVALSTSGALNWGDLSSAYSSVGIAKDGVAAADSRFAFISKDATFGADGSTYDVFLSDSYGASPVFTRISLGGATSVSGDLDISEDGKVLAFGSSATSTIQIYDSDPPFEESQLSDESGTSGTTSISYAAIQGNSSTTGYFNTSGDYLTENSANKGVIATATTGAGVTDVAKIGNDMELLAIDDAGRYGIVKQGTGVEDSSVEYLMWDFQTDAEVKSFGSSATTVSLAGNGTYYVRSSGTGIAWGDQSNEYSTSNISHSQLEASDSAFAILSNDTDLGGDGSRMDVFLSDGYGASPTYTQITLGGTTDIARFALSEDKTVVLLEEASTGTIWYYDALTTNYWDTGLSGLSITSLTVSAEGDYMALVDTSGSNQVLRVYDITNPLTASETANIDLNDATRSFSNISINDAGDAIAFTVDIDGDATPDEGFVAQIDTSGSSSYDFTWDGSTRTFLTNNAGVDKITDDFAENSRNFSIFMLGGSSTDVMLTSQGEYSELNPTKFTTVMRGSYHSGITSAEPTYASESERQSQELLAVDSTGTVGIRRRQDPDDSYYVYESFELSSGKILTTLNPDAHSIDSRSIGLSPDGTNSAWFVANDSKVTYLAGVNSENIPGADATAVEVDLAGGSVSGDISTANSRFAFVAITSIAGGSGTYQELFYTGYHPSAITRVAISGADINETSHSISDDGEIIAYTKDSDGSLYLYDVSETTSTSAFLSGVTDTALDSSGSRIAVLRDVGLNQYIQLFDISFPFSPVLLESQDVTGKTITGLSLNDAGTAVGYVEDGATDEFKILNYTTTPTITDTAIDISSGGTYALNAAGTRMVVYDDTAPTDTVLTVYDISDPAAPTALATIQLGDSALDTLSFNDTGDALVFTTTLSDAGTYRQESFFVDVDSSGAGNFSFDYGSMISWDTNNATVARLTQNRENGVYGTDHAVIMGTAKTALVSSETNELSNNPSEQISVYRANSTSGIVALEPSSSRDQDLFDTKLTALDSSGSYAVYRQTLLSGTIQNELVDLSTGKTLFTHSGTGSYDGLSPDGTKLAASLASGTLELYSSSDFESPRTLLFSGMTGQTGEIHAANSRVVFAAETTSYGGGGVNTELFYTTGGNGYDTSTGVQNVSIGGADISDTSHSISDDGAFIAYTNASTGALFIHTVASTSDTSTGLSGVTDSALDADGNRLAVVRTDGPNQYIELYDITDPASPSLLKAEDVTGLTISNLSINDAGEAIGYVDEGVKDEFKILKYAAGTSANDLGAIAGQVDLGDRTAEQIAIDSSGDTVSFSVEFTGGTNEVFMGSVDGLTDRTYTFKAGEVKRAVTVVESADDVPRPSADQPLDQSLTTRGRASLAMDTLKQLSEEIKKDIGRIESIFEALGGKQVTQIQDPQRLMNQILRNLSGLATVHELDLNRVRDLLLD